MTRGRFTCFFHPKEDMSEHDISDSCPECTRPYSYPLENAPGTIRDYQIVEPLGRGFYAATYSATYGSLGTKVVLKVTPKDTYSHFKKDFGAENRLHLEVAQGTQHLAGIADAFDYDVKFGDTVISCHVASLQYVKGPTLGKFLSDPDNRTARNLAQISVDLFSLMQELSSKQLYHNDLHDNNIIIEQLDRRSYRSGETIEPSIRAIAIDLGSLSEMSKSVPLGDRLGDLLQVVRYILNFRNYLLENPSSHSDVEYRLAIQLDQIGHMLAPDPLSQKEPPYGDIITQLQVGFGRSNSPWKAPFELTSFSESYNAQTLHPGFVRQLLVDPDGEWLASVSGKGPQVITGIRGCGKTMLLKAMQSHSQIIHHVEHSSDIDEAIVNIEKEGYVGLYVPTNRLLDNLGSTSGPVHEPYARLFVAYALEAIRAARHLGELKPSLMSPGYWQYVGKVVTAYIKGTAGLNEAPTETALENQLFAILVSLDRGEDLYTLAGSPAVAFPQLADAVRLTSNVWTNATVLYLLDDVSTRNLGKSDIGDLLGTLLFAHPNCAFKMTTEVQTMELLLKSPGLVETARVGRDYDTFDLAAKVADRLNNVKGIEFVESILASRSRFYPKHPAHGPRRLLGQASLEQIARDIAATTPNAPQKKEVYRGINALTALCVGDIGDILKIYEAILTHFDGSTLPISSEKQSGEFQEYCSKQLYHLNRRKGELKDFALSFARAAHSLLVKSSRAAETAKRRQLRQHTQIYVRVTTGDMVWQFEKLRELVDAGVFVLRGGPDVPRTKTRDANPMQHFILTYRKLYGLSSFIGLSNRDRFELSGEDLLAWLENPATGDQILGKNLGLGEGPNNGDQPTGDIGLSNDNSVHWNKEDDHQLAMPMVIADRKVAVADNEQPMSADNIQTATSYADSVSRLPIITEIADIRDDSGSVATVVSALGFEERTLISSDRLFSNLTQKNVVLVRYQEPGLGDSIRAKAREASANVYEVEYDKVIEDTFVLPEGEVVVDVTGLAKPAIFRLVAGALSRDHTVVIAHTQADVYYPLDEDIEPILASTGSDDMFTVLERAQKIWTGEKGPYEFVRLFSSDVDQARRRLLCAAVSPQHERLLSLIEQRDYDGLCIIEPTENTPRTRLALLAADVATQGRFGSRRVSVDSDDLIGIMSLLGNQFDDFYSRNWFDIEFGLTGSKMHTVACAAASVVLKIAQCWYVKPREFDPNRFTKGAKGTRFFRISLPDSFPHDG